MTKRITTLDYALLGLLSQSAQSGYDLRKTFETTAMGSFSGSPGAIYPALGRLERQGLVSGEVDTTNELRPRKVFRPTSAGKKTLRIWLARDIDRDDVAHRFDELMLRFAFHWVLGSSKATRRFLERLLTSLEVYLSELTRQYKGLPKETPLQSRLALAAGVEQYRASARWARAAIKQFAEEDS